MTVPLLEFAASEAAVGELELMLAQATHAAARAQTLVALAWQLRQRDTERSLQLAQQAEALLQAPGELPADEQQCLLARLLLVRGEVQWLHGDTAAADALTHQALLHYDTLDDACGHADAFWLLSRVTNRQGDAQQTEAALGRMIGLAREHDRSRVDLAEASLAMDHVTRDLAAARLRWDELLTRRARDSHTYARAWIENYRGAAHGLSSEYGPSVQHFVEAYRLALDTGQLGLAMLAASNAGVTFNHLNSPEPALEWTERSLALARRTGWPNSLALALVQTASSLRIQGRLSTARSMVEEALALLQGQPASRNRALALGQLAGIEMDSRQFEPALASFRRFEQEAQAIANPDLAFEAWSGQARALHALGDAPQARALAQQVLDGTERKHLKITALELIAEIQQDAGALSALQRAMQLAGEIDGYVPRPELYDALAQACARQGDSAQAYAYALQAGQALEHLHEVQAGNRTTALELAQETERSRLQHAQLRRQAQQEEARAESLQQLHAMLEKLGDVGREITRHLDSASVFAALERHAHGLLEASGLRVFRLDAGALSLSLVHGQPAAALPATCVVELSDALDPVARCARARSELAIDDAASHRSLYAPLLAGERLLGVLSVQIPRRETDGERERALFRGLCAFGAIALANVDTLQALREAQAQVAQQERLASLGQLVANVAHEINTPVAVVKSSGQNIADSLAHTLARLPAVLLGMGAAERALFFLLLSAARQSGELLSSRAERVLARQLTQELQAAGVADARTSAELLLRLRAHKQVGALLPLLRHAQAATMLALADGLATLVRGSANINTAAERMAKIVFALQRFSERRTDAPWQELDLRASLEAVLHSYQHQIRQGVELVLDLPDGLRVHGLPDELGQVWSNLIHNALQAMQHKGRLGIAARLAGQELQVSVSDNGCGIPEALRARIFDAFFTTKPSGEGSGLGLDIVQKIVARHGGRVELQSELGRGSTFTVCLPLRAAGPEPALS